MVLRQRLTRAGELRNESVKKNQFSGKLNEVKPLSGIGDCAVKLPRATPARLGRRGYGEQEAENLGMDVL